MRSFMLGILLGLWFEGTVTALEKDYLCWSQLAKNSPMW